MTSDNIAFIYQFNNCDNSEPAKAPAIYNVMVMKARTI